MKVCIVTPDVVGPIRNGGIGTHCFHLARLLASHNHDVTIVFTGPLENGTVEHWKQYYRSLNIRFEAPHEDSHRFNPQSLRWHLAKSIMVHDFLKEQNFNVIHFQDWQANGFVPIQARVAGLAYQHTIITNTLHSPTVWQHEGQQEFPPNPCEYLSLDYCERYCFAHADYVLSPTIHMFDWARGHKWTFGDAVVKKLWYPFLTADELEGLDHANEADLSHLIFFGRVETRKGFEIFSSALTSILGAPDCRIKKITIVGKEGRLSGFRRSASSVIREMRRTYPKIELKWHRYLNHIEAMKFISESRGLLVSPSLMDNSPFTLIEAMSYAVPVLASRVGGIPEIIGIDEVLFEPNDKALAAAIQNAANVDFGSLNYTYSAEKANQEWLEFHRTLESWRRPTREPSPLRPKVSVCIFHHNMGDYLEKAIESIAQNTYESFEVICVDDGSTNETDMQRFSRIESKYGHFGWRVERQETSGIGKALNRAASLARGDFLIFMDVDSIARPDMIETMVRAIQSSENDCLTCHSLGYASLEAADTTNPILRYAPLGPCLELSCIENVFGGGSFIIKKEVFESVGGFVEDTPSSCEDWEFLSKLALKGYKMDVVPEAVLLRQVTDPGHGRTIESYANYHRILRPWRQVADAHIHNIAFLSLTLHSQVSGGALSIISTLDLLAGAIRSRLEAGRLKAFAPFFGKCFSAAKHVLSFFGVGR